MLPATLILAAGAYTDAPRAKVNVVTTLSTYASITREIAGDRADVSSISMGTENPHFVQPKPSFVLRLRKADMLVATGLDLELWMPALLDKAGNSRIKSGGPGFVAAYPGVRLVDVPATVSRSQGDIHAFGNPHIWTSPINAIVIAENILTGLKRIDGANANYYEANFNRWKDGVIRAYAGDELVDLLGADVIFDLGKQGELLSFVSSQEYEGRPLASRLGGWLKAAEPFRGKEMVCYHKEWDYFSNAFGVPCIEYIEPKPGIPPTPRHVAEVISLMKDKQIKVLFSTNYYDKNQVQSVARRTGARAVIVPSNTNEGFGVPTYRELVSLWVRELAHAFSE